MPFENYRFTLPGIGKRSHWSFSILPLLIACFSVFQASSAVGQTFIIEAEDFNYESGQHRTQASQMPYQGGAYANLRAIHNVDYFQVDNEASSDTYRTGETPNVPMTENPDFERGTYTATTNYRIGWTGQGDWYNYTRNFPEGQYKVFAALSHAGTNPGELKGSLQKVERANTADQAVQELGVFDAPGSGGWGLNNLVPLKRSDGTAALVTLGANTTVRFTAASGDIDYYKFVLAAAPQVSEHPASQSVVEGQTVTFRVVAADGDAINYQWQSNQVNIAGATASSYTIPFAPFSANGAKFRCVLSNTLGTITSSEATLTVTPETTKPEISRVLNLGLTSIVVVFSEPVSSSSATTVSNYGLSGGISISSAAMGSVPDRVVLTTSSPLSYGSTYTLTVNNVADRAAAQNVILPNSQKTLQVMEYTPQNIGGTGDTVAVAGGYNLTSEGSDIGGSADRFHFAYQERTGNFDIQVRVASAIVTDPFFQAGLMARENHFTNSRFAGIFTSSAQLGCFFESRATANTASVTTAPAGGFPANYPNTWLRLQRVGNQFTGYASFDAKTWTQIGSTSISLPSTIYLGMAVSGNNAEQATTVQFREIGSVTSTATSKLVMDHERLGPSSRRTGLVISEIMYHPKARADGKNLEFVEIYNAGSIFEDLTGHRMDGDITFTFPAGTTLQAGEFLVIAKAPADFQEVYSPNRVLGPYSRDLPNSAGSIQLYNELGTVLQDVEYSDEMPWPAAADGAGHSLILARPSYGESDVRAWAASSLMGGSPGTTDSVVPSTLKNVVINEFLAHTDDPQLDFVELYNHSSQMVDLSGCWLTDDPQTNKFRIPHGTTITAGGFISFDQSQLGFSLDAAGEAVYLIDPERTRVLDAIRFGAQENGVSSGRWPDGSATMRRLASLTPGAANSRWRSSEVVINEIMFAPISGDGDDEYVELHNTSSQAVQLGGWQLTGGVDFRFPDATIIPANGYVVIAKNAAKLTSRYSQLNANNTFGNFAGSLRNGGERLALAKPDLILKTNETGEVISERVLIVVNELTYEGGGRWGQWANEGGSSLELIDPRSDNTQPDNWADSDETAKGQWSTVEFTGRLDNGHSSYPPNQLQVTLQGAGECLLDSVEVFETGGANLVSNGGFESGATGWTFQGNHSQSVVVTSGAAEGSSSLHIRAPGRGDTGMNRIRTALAAGLAANDTATIRARVRWLKGWPEVLLRLRGSWLECAGSMAIPQNLGTPGQVNSRWRANAGPAIYDVTHTPILPSANEAVTITARVSDPDGVASLNVRFRIDPSSTTSTIAMRDDGVSGDAVAGDGLYSASISGRSAGTLIAFYVEAADAAGNAMTTRFPSDAPVRECLIRWGETLPFGTFGTYRIWTSQKTTAAWSSGGALNNTYRDMTFVYNGDRVVYNGGIKDKGSPFHGGSGDYFIVMPDDEPFLGTTDLALCSVGNTGGEDTAQREQIAYWIGRKIGSHYLHRRYVNVFLNGNRFRNIIEDSEEPNGDFAQSRSPEADDGDLYKIEDWFEFNDAASSFANVDATLQKFTTTGNQYKLARYRWAWRKRAVEGSANNYTNLFDLVTVVNIPRQDSNYVAQVMNQVDVEGWMRTFALQRIVGNWDSYGFSRGKNAYIYKPDGLKWEMYPWDIDFVLGSGSNGPTDGLWGAGDPVINSMYDTPAFRRMLWQAYLEAVNGPLLPANYGPQIDERYRVLLANGISGINNPSAIKSYIEQRRANIVSRMSAADATTFAIRSNNGNNFSTNRAMVTLTGTAPFSVYTIQVNGVSYPLTWTSERDWVASIPLSAASTLLNFVGYDRNGQPVANATDSITITSTAAIPRVEDYVVINEIMYNPIQPGASFIELFNRLTTSSFDLSGFRLEGVSYTFPEGSIIQPAGYLSLVQDRLGFSSAYGGNVLIFDQFTGSLDNGGETLRLVKPGATADQDINVDEVRYDDDQPWPTDADGKGPSLQLVDASQDNWRPGNWSVTATNATNRATPGAANATRSSLLAFPNLWINEVQPNNVNGLADRMGDRDPWIELYNADSSASIDLGALYLSDDYSNLMKWQFPAGSTLGPRQFMVVWVDNEPAESSTTEFHTNFRLNASTGSIALSRMQNGQPAAVDYLSYTLLGAGRSFGSYPDGHSRTRRIFHFASAGATNNPASAPINVMINEWLAGNTQTIADPADGDFDDWIELFNAGTTAVDLSGYTLSDSLTNTTKFVIPNGTVIQAGGHLLVWADEEPNQNGRTQDLHANFKLSAGGEQIGLFAPDGSVVDSLTFSQQSNDVSEGRTSDGAEPPFVFFTTPTPGQPNFVIGGNRPPVLATVGNRTVAEGSQLTFKAIATDADTPAQTLTYSLSSDAPVGTLIDQSSGTFIWTPTEAQGPGSYSFLIRVTDNGTPNRSTSERITVTVEEVNKAPTLPSIADQTIDEGSLLTLKVVAADEDVPANTLRYSLMGAAPSGAAIDPETGVFTWMPQEAHGPGLHNILIQAIDNGTPQLSAVQLLTVHVNEVNNPPVLDPVLPQTINEGITWTYALKATDSDSPPASIIYSLEQGGPAGAMIDAITGLITWTPTEEQGPSTNVFTVRATENNAGRLTDTRTFTVVVQEMNQAPVLEPITNYTILEGDSLEFIASARDNDRPAQALIFSLTNGSEAGASIDPNSGRFVWTPRSNQTGSSQSFSVRVTDNGPGGLSDTKTFTVMVQARSQAVINEIMYAPVAANGHYIELLNPSSAATIDLSGWKLSGKELSFTFPAGTRLQPGALVTVVQNQTAFQAAYGTGIAVAGQWTGTLLAQGDTLQLIKPAAGQAPETLVDKVTFSNGQPWPASANKGGAALQLVDARRDNNRAGNWSASAGYTGPSTLVVMTNSWKYNQAAADPGASWKELSYNDSSWSSGRALLYVENSDVPAAKNTPLTLGPTTFYFRTRFTLPTKPIGAQLRLSYILDDGAIFYLNGQEIHRIGLPAGAVNYGTFASRTVSEAVLEGPVTIPGDLLQTGENILAVEVHQVNATSSDIVFGCSLNLEGGSLPGFTPGRTNSVVASLPEFPSLYINEVLPNNVNGLQDGAGERQPWMELYNAGTTTVSLDGYYLTDSYTNLNKWPFPAGALIAPGQFMTVWLDGEPNESTSSELHPSFRLSTSGAIALTRTQNDQVAVVDYVNFANSAADVSIGSIPDGQLDERVPLTQPSPGASNKAAPQNQPPVIATIADRTINTGELLSFTIAATDPDQPAQVLTYNLEPGAPQGCEVNAITGQFAWTPSAGQANSTNQIIVRVTDNGQPSRSHTVTFTVIVRAPVQTPQVGAAVSTDGKLQLRWVGQTGVRYRVLYKDRLDAETWETLLEFPGTGEELTAADNEMRSRPSRFYRIVVVP